MEKFQFNGYPAFSLKLSDGRIVAYLDYCPHKGRPITAEGFKLEKDAIVCPFHEAAFDLKTGSLLRAPYSKTPCPPQCSLIRLILDDKNEPVRFESEPRMPELPEKRETFKQG
jgi:Ferredoxin subunits of nitrite reductase and ring-hydroxylating dioxygenases